jgi:hypothetical protein
MKKLFLLLIIGVVIFSSCQKTQVKPSSTSTNSQENATVVKTRSAILVSHPWMYQGFYFHYVDKQHKGDPEYVRGAKNNAIDLDATRFTFRSNGTFVELDGGYRYPGTWNFTDNTATVMVMHYSWGDDDCTFVNFSSNHLNFTQPMGYNSLSFTELIPAQ